MNTITKNIARLLFLFVLFFGTILKAQSIEKINPVFDPPGNYYLTLGAFTDTLNGWIAEPNINKIWFTVDGGLTWRIQKEVGDEKIQDIYFLDYGHGWAVSTLPSEDSSKIYYTKDGGTNWTSYTAPLIYTINFINESTGIGVGKYGIYKTTDGGRTWQKKNLDYDGELLKSRIFLKDNFGYSIGSKYNPIYNYYSQSIIKTTDYGENWELVFILPAEHPSSGWFFSEDRGFITGIDNVLLLITDGGNTWENKNDNIGGHWVDIAFFDNNNGWLVGQGDLAITKDGGNTWEELTIAPECCFEKIVLIKGSDTGFILGPYNIIIKIKKGGTTGIKENEIIPDEFRLLQNYPNPFNPSTIIEYEVNLITDVTIKIYDLLGNEIKILDLGKKHPGKYKLNWNGFDSWGRKVGSGIYFCRMFSKQSSQTIKINLLR